MTEVIFSAPDQAHLIAAASAMGFYDAKAKTITTAAKIAAGGNYFLNIVGVVYQPTGDTQVDAHGNTVPVMAAFAGIWGRLRHNGDPATVPALPANSGITLYRLFDPQDGKTPYWSSDGGVTAAPDYVAAIGMIA